MSHTLTGTRVTTHGQMAPACCSPLPTAGTAGILDGTTPQLPVLLLLEKRAMEEGKLFGWKR